ncbi:MAG: ABC transporter ATP-binding protein [Acidimicrobiales bacterium]
MSDGRIDIRGASKRFGLVEVLREITLDIATEETLVLLGPSGCGKTTLLRCIAGLERIDGGEIELDGTVVSHPGGHIRPEERRIGMVFQDWALFPHLTIGENVGYGLSRQQRKGGRIAEALGLVGLVGLEDRMPSTLSGGQQQRVALARALAPRPRALLLDEPFSNLDTALRAQVRSEVHRVLLELGVTTVFVTHDQEEAFVLGDRVAVMHAGRIEQHAPPAEIYEQPASRWIAGFVGEANFVRGHANGDRADSPYGTVPLSLPRHGSTDLLLRPEHLELLGDPAGTDAVVELVEYHGHDHVAVVRFDDGRRLRSRGSGASPFRRGDRVTARTSGRPTIGFDPDD